MDLRCNLRSCGKLLEGKVWVTSCHHIFCDKDGQLAFLDSHREPLAHRCCPVCETPVNPTNYGVLRKELDPTMEFRAIMLVGLKPDIIAETVAKAMVNDWLIWDQKATDRFTLVNVFCLQEFWLHQAEFEKKLQVVYTLNSENPFCLDSFRLCLS